MDNIVATIRKRPTFILALLLGISTAAPGATIGLESGFPNLRLANGAMTYTYTAICQKNNGDIGPCGAPYNTARWDLTTGLLSVTGNVLTLDSNGAGFQNVTNDAFTLTVKFGFNATGTAVVLKIANDTPDDLVVSGNTAVAGFAGSNLVTGEIADATVLPVMKSLPFGYLGTEQAGIFEFVFNFITGNFSTIGSTGSIIVSTTNLNHPLLPAGGAIESWDSKGVNFWKSNFSGTAQVDTIIPVPAAIWLFGSAVAGLASFARRRNDPISH